MFNTWGRRTGDFSGQCETDWAKAKAEIEKIDRVKKLKINLRKSPPGANGRNSGAKSEIRAKCKRECVCVCVEFGWEVRNKSESSNVGGRYFALIRNKGEIQTRAAR